MNAIEAYRIERFFYIHHMTIVAKIIRALIYLIHNCYIPYTAQIGKGTKLGYKGIGVVIHAKAVIGERCIIAQNVTIGGRKGHDGVPALGNDVYVGAGAVILGGGYNRGWKCNRRKCSSATRHTRIFYLRWCSRESNQNRK